MRGLVLFCPGVNSLNITPGAAYGGAGCYFLSGLTHRQGRIHFESQALKLGVAGTRAGARLAAIMQAILLAQWVRRLETIPILQTILVLLTSLIGGRQRRCRDGHDQRYDDE